MRVAITGGRGFIGTHLAHRLVAEGHEVVLITRSDPRRDHAPPPPGAATIAAVGIDDERKLAESFRGCDAVAHCAGINREIAEQTYGRVHVDGTRSVVNACRLAGVRKIVLVSFVHARPNCGSAYHESKWAAEEIVRASGLDFTVLKAGMTYGRGDHMLDHLSHALHTFPVFALVGLRERYVRPLAVEDLVTVLSASLVRHGLSRQTVAVLGPESMPLRTAVSRVAAAVDKRPPMIRMPIWFHYGLAWVCERVMVVPLVAVAQVRILTEDMIGPLPGEEEVPTDLRPRLHLVEPQIRKGLPNPGPFTAVDCRCFSRISAAR